MEGFYEFQFDIGKIHLRRFASGYYIDINYCQVKAYSPEILTYISFNSITQYSRTNLFTDSKTKSCNLEIIFLPNNKKSTNRNFMFCGSKLNKLRSLPQMSDFGKCSRCLYNQTFRGTI